MKKFLLTLIAMFSLNIHISSAQTSGITFNIHGDTLDGITQIQDTVPDTWVAKSAKAAKYEIEIKVTREEVEKCDYIPFGKVTRNIIHIDIEIMDLQESKTIIATRKFTAYPKICGTTETFEFGTDKVYDGEINLSDVAQWVIHVISKRSDLPKPAPQAGLLLTLENPLGGVYRATFSPDGSEVTTVGAGPITIWDAKTGKQLRQIKEENSTDYEFLSAVYSPNGKIVLAGLYSGDIQLWDAVTTKKIRDIDAGGFTNDVQFSPDGTRIIAALGFSLRVWDAQTGKELLTVAADMIGIYSVAFNPNGKEFVAGDYNSIQVFDTKNGKVLRKFDNAVGISTILFSPDGNYIFTSESYSGCSLHLLDAVSGRTIKLVKDEERCFSLLSFSPDAKTFVLTDKAHILEIWDVATFKPLYQLDTRGVSTWGLRFSSDGKQLAFGSEAGFAQVWDLTQLD